MGPHVSREQGAFPVGGKGTGMEKQNPQGRMGKVPGPDAPSLALLSFPVKYNIIESLKIKI